MLSVDFNEVMKMKIGIVYDRKKPEAKKLALEIKKWLGERKHEVLLPLKKSAIPALDFIVTFGGDGLVLRTANKVAVYEIPLLRVNFGYVGFLTNIEPREALEKLSDVLDKENYIIKKRARIEVLLKDKSGNVIAQKDALNDVVIERVGTRAIACKVSINGKEKEYRGDGVIFATRTGSTAYAESAGGPTLIKDDKFILRVISPSNRESLPYLIKPDNTVFRVNKVLGRARLVVDGTKISNIAKECALEIGKSSQESMFMEIGDMERLKNINRKNGEKNEQVETVN